MACNDESVSPAPGEPVTIVFKHSKLFGDPQAFDALIKRFEDGHAGIRVRTEALPSSSDEQHQFYVINLRAESADFDVMALDVIWVAEFARAGWLRDLSETFATADREDFFKGPLAAIRYRDRVYAVPCSSTPVCSITARTCSRSTNLSRPKPGKNCPKWRPR